MLESRTTQDIGRYWTLPEQEARELLEGDHPYDLWPVLRANLEGGVWWKSYMDPYEQWAWGWTDD